MVAQARKERLDLLIVQRGLAEDQEHARRLIMAGRVSIGDRVVDKPGTRVPTAADVKVKDESPYVSRGDSSSRLRLTPLAWTSVGVR